MQTTDETPVLDEQIWRAWIQRGKIQERATIRKFKAVTGIVVGVFAIGSVLYILR